MKAGNESNWELLGYSLLYWAMFFTIGFFIV